MGSSSSFVRWRLTNGHLTFCLIQNSTDMKRYIVLVDVPNYKKVWEIFASLEGALRYREEMFELYAFENPQISIIQWEEE